jgi:Tol biopolymer transport system component
MEADRRRQTSQLYHAALLRAVPDRAAFVREACGDDDVLQREVESLLALDGSAQNFLNTPAAAAATRLMADVHHVSLIGRQLGAYRVDSWLGAGGMGEVYRARDTKLGRDVAIKILPRLFVSEPERLARFAREARLLASLNHPHIGAIYGLEDVDGIPALVLELIDGVTLADRLAKGPLPVREALTIAVQIADALDAAHEKGIVHRDLKPANVKITPEGMVKVLDFGLAKAFARGGSVPDLLHMPTVTATELRPGAILGTPAYMSPEQARGQAIDKRTDIWAFGCVLYEMLTGRHVFAGNDVSEVLASVLAREPDFALLPTDTPSSIRRLLRRCLQKEPKERLHDISDARIEIQDADAKVDPDVTIVLSRRGRERLAWIVAVLLAMVSVVAVAVAIASALRPPPAAREVRLEITTPPTTDQVSLALSPDGQSLVFVADSEGQPRLWLRSLEAISSRRLAGTDGAAYPFWSPDSRSIGFFAQGKLKRLDIAGGAAQTLANADIGRGGSWNRDGVILFAPSTFGPIFRVSDRGGEPVAVTRLGILKPVGHRFPQFLPDGRHFLFSTVGSPKGRGVYVASLDGSVMRRLLDAETAAVVASGHVLFVRQGTLFAQSFDPVRLELAGSPFSVVEDTAFDRSANIAALSSSAAGSLAYRAGTAGDQRQFLWFDRSGKQVGKLGDPDTAAPANPQLSPDGRRVALNRTMNGQPGIWLLDTGRGVLSRFTFDAPDALPVWSPDGRRLVFGSRRDTFDLYEKPASGGGTEELVLTAPGISAPTDWSTDGRFLLYRSDAPNTGSDIWALPMGGNRKPFPVIQTDFDERDGQFSPDGRWIAYESNESGRFEIYVQPFPGPGSKWQMSTNGGAQVRWRRDGRELFYIGLDSRLMTVPLQVASGSQTLEPGTPVSLFATRIFGGALQGAFKQQYVVSPDGQRFLINSLTAATTSPITLILNWKPK